MFDEYRHQEQHRSTDEDIHLTARTLVFVLVVMLVMMLVFMFVLVVMLVLVVMPTIAICVMRMFARMFHNTICVSFSISVCKGTATLSQLGCKNALLLMEPGYDVGPVN